MSVSVRPIVRDAQSFASLGGQELPCYFPKPLEKMNLPAPHLLVVEDEPTLMHVLQATLEFGGFTSDSSSSALEALQKLAELRFDGVLMDLNLPDSDGFQLLKAVRAMSNVPVVVVSGRGAEQDRVSALDEGADDFVQKPFMPAELLARIRAVLRRRGSFDGTYETPQPAAAAADPPPAPADSAEADLTASERRLFDVLQGSWGKVVSTRAIVSAVWGDAPNRDAHHVRVLVTNLRKKLSRADDRIAIENDRGIGYRLLRRSA